MLHGANRAVEINVRRSAREEHKFKNVNIVEVYTQATASLEK